jgi:hypothetical protein
MRERSPVIARGRRRGKPGPLPTSGRVGGSAFFGASLSHALQLEIRRRSRACLLYQFSYAFSKTLSNSTGDNQTNFEPLLDNNNPRLEKARSPYDITHAFKANFVYELPYGPGKRWSGGKLMNELLGGWSLSGHLELQCRLAVFGGFRPGHVEPGRELHLHRHRQRKRPPWERCRTSPVAST